MLDDAVVSNGRQIKWKYIIGLVFLALAALASAWLLEFGTFFQFYGPEISLEGQWISSGCGPDTEAVACGEGLALQDGDCVTILAENQSVSRAGHGLLLPFGESVLLYEASGTSVTILNAISSITVEVPGGVDRVIPGEDSFGVITAGSGYLTRTDFFDSAGNPLWCIGLRDSAMVYGAFSEEIFGGLCYKTEGIWVLRLYDMDEMLEIPLDAAVCYELIPVNGNFAVLTEDGLLFFSRDGEELGHYLTGTGELLAWESGDYLAMVLENQEGCHLMTFSPDGEILGQTALSMRIRDLEILGNNVCVLDAENLRLYNAFCDQYASSPAGARCVSLLTGKNCLWLLGDGEIMKLKFVKFCPLGITIFWTKENHYASESVQQMQEKLCCDFYYEN